MFFYMKHNVFVEEKRCFLIKIKKQQNQTCTKKLAQLQQRQPSAFLFRASENSVNFQNKLFYVF